MRVLQIDSGREWRGGQNQVRLLCRELTRAGIEQTLVTKRDSELARRAAADGTKVLEVPWGWGLDPRAWFQLRRAVSDFKPDILHAHDSHALWMARRAAGQAPLVATRRVDFHIGRFSTWRRADHLIAISRAVQNVLAADGVPATGISVIPDGIDPAEVRHAADRPLDVRGQLGLPPRTPFAVNVAALVDHKDHLTLIRAAGHARATLPELHWVIAGEGELRGSLRVEITRLGLTDRVHLLGYVEAADALIQESDVFVMSSKEEGLGSVILNALALGKPVIATAAGGIPEILPAEALVPVGDAAGLATKVIAALSHPASRIPFPARFTAAAMAQGVLALYHALV